MKKTIRTTKPFESIKVKSKSNYYKNRLDKYQNNVKKTWDVIKEIIGNSKLISHTLPKRLIINNAEIFDKKSISEQFNKYVVNVGPNLAELIPKSNKKIESFISGQYPILKESPLADEELKNEFASLKPNKSPGFDDINSNVVRFVFDALIKPIKYIFDISLNKGIFPNKLKLARVTPIFKTGDKEHVNNYRHISVLTCF